MLHLNNAKHQTLRKRMQRSNILSCQVDAHPMAALYRLDLLIIKKNKMKFRPMNRIGWMASACLALFLLSCDKNNGPRYTEYALPANGNSGISGIVRITETSPTAFNVKVSLTGSKKDTVHPMRIYNGTPENPLNVALTLTSVTGTGGPVSGETANITQIKGTDGNNKNFNYDSILKHTAFIRVNFSAFNPDSVIARGKIGKLN
jgi:hypothetical protein